MKKSKPLTCTFHIGGKQVEKLTSEQSERVAQRFAEALSRYYSQHPDEFLEIKDVDLIKSESV